MSTVTAAASSVSISPVAAATHPTNQKKKRFETREELIRFLYNLIQLERFAYTSGDQFDKFDRELFLKMMVGRADKDHFDEYSAWIGSSPNGRPPEWLKEWIASERGRTKKKLAMINKINLKYVQSRLVPTKDDQQTMER